MGIAETIAAVNALLGIGLQLYNSIDQTQGNVPIPSWDELANKNTILQAKIEVEK